MSRTHKQHLITWILTVFLLGVLNVWVLVTYPLSPWGYIALFIFAGCAASLFPMPR